MSQQKYRYYFQHEETGHITFKEYELEEIESYDGIQIPHRYFITARCQFTGLLSKDGVEIYEGDIIGFDMDTFYKRIFTVIYDSGRFGIQTDEGFRCLSDWIITQKDNNTISCEVIGNIYENPELLKKGNELC